MIIRGAKIYIDHRFETRDIYVAGDRIAAGATGVSEAAEAKIAGKAEIAEIAGKAEIAEDGTEYGSASGAASGEASGAASGEAIGEEILDASGLYAIPGLVDLHFHGVMGHDFCDGDIAGLHAIASYEAAHGITSICPATMTCSEEVLGRVMDTAKDFVPGAGEASLVGINLEGPFISPKKIGAQNPAYVKAPDIDMYRRLQERSGGLIRLLDVAPETEGGPEMIGALKTEAKLSVAHTTADYETAKAAFDAGAAHMTHLFNAMPGIHHREPGPILAAYEAHAEVELITDGIHLHPAIVRLAFDMFDDDKVILISDSMEATGMPDGTYALGGLQVTKKGRTAVLADHPETIAGSASNLYEMLRTAVCEMGVPMEKAVRAATENPARAIGVEGQYGTLAPGSLANILLVDEELSLKKVILRGVPLEDSRL